MKTSIKLALGTVLWAAMFLQPAGALAQGTAFTYQGRLDAGGAPANGIYDLRFAIYDAASAGVMQGGPVTNAATGVSNGLFTVTLDFGAGVFTGPARWLDIGVRTNAGSAFATLSPRQKLTPMPYAIQSANATAAGSLTGTLPATQLTGTLPLAQLPPAVVTNNATSVALRGAFSGNGAGLTNLNASALASGAVPAAALGNAWKTTGNAGANPTNGAFLGTTDNLPLELKVKSLRVLRLEHATNSAVGYSPNLVGGHPENVVSNGLAGAVIGGGGFAGAPNIAGGHFATVPGGAGNVASGYASTAMGNFTTASGHFSTAMGSFATASGNTAFAMGDYASAGGDYAFAVGTGTRASGLGSLALGYFAVARGRYATAMGSYSEANETGTFVWADSTDAPFGSTKSNQFLLRASNGVGIGLTNPAAQLEVSSNGGDGFPQARINQTTLADYARLRFTVGGDYNKRWDLACRSNAFVIYSGQTGSEALRLENNNAYVNGALVLTSDRNAKENFQPVDPRAVLEKVAALPLQEWNYRADAAQTKHLGPMAQDFHAAFGLNGDDDKHIATVDADGVALAAIQGLNQKMEAKTRELGARSEELEARSRKLEAENAELKARLEKLERWLESRVAGGAR